MHPRLPLIFAALYSLLLVYASLMPYDFSFGQEVMRQYALFWKAWPFDLSARMSGSDVVSNLVLYVPLGWFVAVGLRLRRFGRGSGALISILVCSVLSGCIEAVQLTIVSRTGSGSDWLLNSVSGLVGAAVGASCGKGLWVVGLRWFLKAWREQPAKIAAVAVITLLCADALSPFLPTILTRQVWSNLKKSHLDPVSGLLSHPWHWWLVTRVMAYACLTMLVYFRKSGEKRMYAWFRAAFLAGSFAVVLEFTKIMIVSRSMNAGNIITSWLGCSAGAFVGFLMQNRAVSQWKVTSGLVVLLVYLVYLAWQPFDFVWQTKMLTRAFFRPVQLLPFYDYAMGGKLEQARLFVQSILLMAFFTYLVRIKLGWFENSNHKIMVAAVFSALLGLVLEGGQVFLPSRTPSMTDVYCFVLGGMAGAWIRPSRKHICSGTQGI